MDNIYKYNTTLKASGNDYKKIVFWNRFSAGMVPLILLVSILGSLQLIFIGLMGEYILSMNQRLMNRPLVVEEERLNFDDADKSDK